jgi:hypothetical protein
MGGDGERTWTVKAGMSFGKSAIVTMICMEL